MPITRSYDYWCILTIFFHQGFQGLLPPNLPWSNHWPLPQYLRQNLKVYSLPIQILLMSLLLGYRVRRKRQSYLEHISSMRDRKRSEMRPRRSHFHRMWGVGCKERLQTTNSSEEVRFFSLVLGPVLEAVHLGVVVIDAVPKRYFSICRLWKSLTVGFSSSGKILRRQLRDIAERELAGRDPADVEIRSKL